MAVNGLATAPVRLVASCGLLFWGAVRLSVRRLRRSRFGACASDARFDAFGSFVPPEKMYFGKRIFIGRGARVSASEGFWVGDDAKIGPELVVMGGDHNFSVVGRPLGQVQSGGVNLPVRIEAGAWLGARVTLLKGVTVGEGSVVGAGSIVTRDVPPYTVCAGNPCRPLRPRFTASQLEEHLQAVDSGLRLDDVLASWRETGL